MYQHFVAIVCRRWQWPLGLLLLVVVAAAATGDPRTWSDATGSYQVDAEFVELRQGDVVLRRTDGQEIAVPLKQLSKADQDFVSAQTADQPASAPAESDEVVTDIAAKFYGELRSKERTGARQALTTTAQKLMEGGRSPLTGLPTPEAGARSIRVGRIHIDGTVAEALVQVRAGGKMHKTKLHLRYEDDSWRVFALSAKYPDGERSINFEAEIAPQQEKQVDPLAALVGQRMELSGRTLDGSAVNLAQYRGKVVLVDFWATWCGPCRAEIPNILANYKQYHGDGFEVIAVSVDRDLGALQKFVAAEQPPWAVVADQYPGNRKSMAAKYGIRGIPAFILVGQDGKVTTVHCRGQRLGQALAQQFATGG